MSVLTMHLGTESTNSTSSLNALHRSGVYGDRNLGVHLSPLCLIGSLVTSAGWVIWPTGWRHVCITILLVLRNTR
jgi:hypothetical protein